MRIFNVILFIVNMFLCSLSYANGSKWFVFPLLACQLILVQEIIDAIKYNRN